MKLTSSEPTSSENEWLVLYPVRSVCQRSLNLAVIIVHQGLEHFVTHRQCAGAGQVRHSWLLLHLFWGEADAACAGHACHVQHQEAWPWVVSVDSKNVFAQSGWVKSPSWPSRRHRPGSSALGKSPFPKPPWEQFPLYRDGKFNSTLDPSDTRENCPPEPVPQLTDHNLALNGRIFKPVSEHMLHI